MSPVITQVVFDLIHQEQTDEAIEAIVEETMEKGLGARGLRGATEKVLEDYMFDIEANNEIVLTRDNIKF